MTRSAMVFLLRRRGLWRAALIAAITLLMPLAFEGVASASTNNYSKAWTFKSSAEGICVIFTVSGNLSYTYNVTSVKSLTLYHWNNIELNDPKLTAVIHAYSGGSCSGPALATRLEMGQSWSGYSCSLNPSLSVSFPWGVSFGFWPSCGDRNQVDYATDYSTTATGYTQNNSGNQASFGSYSSQVAYPPCYGVYIYGTAYEGSSSDSVTSGADSVCV